MPDGTTMSSNQPFDIMDAVRSSAMLASVSFSEWTAMRTDKERVEDLRRQHGAVGNVGNFQKNLLAGADAELKAVHSAFSAVRSFHYSLTLPWNPDPHARKKDGPALLATTKWFEHLTGCTARKKAAMEGPLEEFLSKYDNTCVPLAKQHLGTMADAFYPPVDAVRAMFSIRIEYQPIPETSGFRGLPQQAIDHLGKTMQKRHEQMLVGAMNKVWAQTRERLLHLAERLTEPDPSNPLSDTEWGKRFKTSTLGNVEQLLTMLPAWNVIGSAELDECVGDIQQLMSGVTRDLMIDNVLAREDVAVKARNLIQKLDKWGV